MLNFVVLFCRRVTPSRMQTKTLFSLYLTLWLCWMLINTIRTLNNRSPWRVRYSVLLEFPWLSFLHSIFSRLNFKSWSQTNWWKYSPTNRCSSFLAGFIYIYPTSPKTFSSLQFFFKDSGVNAHPKLITKWRVETARNLGALLAGRGLVSPLVFCSTQKWAATRCGSTSTWSLIFS